MKKGTESANGHIKIDFQSQSFVCTHCGTKEEFTDTNPDMSKFVLKGEEFRKKHELCKKIQLDDGESILLFMQDKCNKVWKRFERYMKKRYNAEFYGLGLMSYIGQECFFIRFLETENIYIDILHTTAKYYECAVFANVGVYTDKRSSSAIGQRIYSRCERNREEAMTKCISEAFIYLQRKI